MSAFRDDATGGYAVWPRGVREVSDRRLRSIAHDDMEDIRVWRNAQLDVLRQKQPLTAAGQEQYWQQVLVPSFAEREPRQVLFGYDLAGQRIGYGGLVHIDWESKRGEVSYLVSAERAADERVYAADFSSYLALVAQVAFEDLGFERLVTETFDVRPRHVALLEQFGFVPEGRMRRHVKVGERWVDSLIHGLLRDEPRTRSAT
jgi:RimJ/RimL family protein N-acetyltransferase